MSQAIQFDPIRLPPEADRLREEVRAFLRDEIAAGAFDPHDPAGETFNRAFSRRVGERAGSG